MNKQLLTGLTIVGVAASAGVAYAGVSVIHSASAESAPASQAPVQPVTRTIVYQVGGAGQVTVNVAADTLVVHGSAAAAGWSVVAASATGTHAEVQFSDGVQLVTFTADLVGDDVAVSVTNAEAPGATTVPSEVPSAPIDVVVISDSKTPPPQPAPTPSTGSTSSNHGGGTPGPSATTAPSAGGDDDDDDDHEEEHDADDHEEEEEDD